MLAGPLGAGALQAAPLAGLHLPLPPLDPLGLAAFLLLAPVLEEIVFRGGLQELLERTARGRRPLVGKVTLGNVATSVVFSAVHLLSAPTWLAAAVFLPSVVLGRVRQASSSLVPVILLHAWYNGCYLCLSAGWRPMV